MTDHITYDLLRERILEGLASGDDRGLRLLAASLGTEASRQASAIMAASGSGLHAVEELVGTALSRRLVSFVEAAALLELASGTTEGRRS